MRRIHAVSVSCALFVSSRIVAQESKWPIIQATEMSRSYDLPESRETDTPLRLILRDLQGTPVYRLECHNGDYGVDSEYTYSGDFHCALFASSGSSRVSWNLLATKTPAQQRSDWLNRGRMTAPQLYGACANVPDYGASRRFYLRHMLLTIEFTNVRWKATPTTSGEPKLARFTVHVRASPDPHARTDTAAPSPPPKVSRLCGFPPR